MDILLVILAVICGIIGLAGTVLPILPGPPISFVGLLLIQWSRFAEYSAPLLWILGILTLLISILDTIAPVWMTRRYGGSKAATNGSLLGMLAGLFLFPPFGMIVGPFVGAFLGELSVHRDARHALRIAFLSFIAFLLTTGFKLILCGIMLYYIIAGIF